MKYLLSNVAWRQQALNILTLASSVILLACSIYIYLQARGELDLANRHFLSQQNQNREAADAKQLLDTHATSFGALKARGIIGEAQRLQWLELTEKLSSALDILLVDFTLGKTDTADEMSTAYFNYDIALATTAMDFVINLRHEGEFFQYMEGLRLNAMGLFSVDECRIRRQPVSVGSDPEFAGLRAKCRVAWYSLEDVSSDWSMAQP